MQKYSNTVTKRTGAAIEGASVAVTTYPAGAAAAIYADDGITSIPGSIVTTDANGHFEFYAADGRYTLSVSGPGITPYTLHDVLLLEDPTDDKAAITALQESVAENSADIAARLPEIGTYALLRAYTGPLTAFHVICREQIFDGAHGDFRVIEGDTTSADNGGTILVDAAGRRWKREFVGAVNVRWFGAKPDNATDAYPAFVAALAAASDGDAGQYTGSKEVVFEGDYYLSSTLEIKQTLILSGAGIGQAGGVSSKLRFASDITGIIVHRYNTIGTGVQSPSTTGGDGSILRNFAIVGAGTSGHGIWLRARATIEQVNISAFGGNGLNIVATAGGGGAVEGNANNFVANMMRIINCGGHGVFVDGADVNAGVMTNIDASSNDGWGIFDSSFLGNTYVACHAATNTLGAYKTDNANARNVLLGCYAESGQPASDLVRPTVVIGGMIGNVTGTAFVLSAGATAVNLTPFFVAGAATGGRTYSTALNRLADETVTLLANGDHANGLALGYWEDTYGCWAIKHARLGSGTSIRLTTSLNTRTGGRATALGGGHVILPNGFFFGPNERAQTNGTAAPTSGEYARGDLIWNISAAGSGKAGWICTTAGTAGSTAVFKTFAAIDA